MNREAKQDLICLMASILLAPHWNEMPREQGIREALDLAETIYGQVHDVGTEG